MNKYVLSKPVDFDGEIFKELDLDFDSLTGEDILSAERQFNAIAAKTRDVVSMKETSKSYLSLVAARAAKVAPELMNKLSAKDFSKVTVLAQNFLLA
ncbi:hypothetical protein A7975_27360 [Bacillus sp. FJAT-26390]|nr:hypothetical protein A7975_27360 [Bacillus sp. FJAT-26390]